MGLKRVLTFGRYLKKRFKTRVYKIPISISGFTCPNIDGTVAKGGCSFCQNDSFSPNLDTSKKKKFYLNLESSENPLLAQQLKELEFQFNATKKRLQTKYGAKKFIVYFQSFTNSYAPFETLKALYEKALSFDDVVGLSIGTRTDSITEETLDFLESLTHDKEIWVEYGIQSVFNQTLKRINRGHDIENVVEWIEKTKKRPNLKICAHLIYGLPDETQEMMLESLKQTLALDIDSIKFHPLYVVENTALTAEYLNQKFIPITKALYIDTLTKSIAMLPKDVSVQRVSAGIDSPSLLAPTWCKSHGEQMRDIRAALKDEGYLY